jgi:hypothetical protein
LFDYCLKTCKSRLRTVQPFSLLTTGCVLNAHPLLTQGWVNFALSQWYIFTLPFALMAMIEPNKPLYVSLGYDPQENYLYIITVHCLIRANGRIPGQEKLKNLSFKGGVRTYAPKNFYQNESLRSVRQEAPPDHDYPRGEAGQ